MSNTLDKSSISPTYPPRQIDYRDGSRHLILRPIEIEDTEKSYAAMEATIDDLRQYMAWIHCIKLNYKTHVEQMITFKQEYLAGKEFMLGLFDGTNGDFLMVLNLAPRRVYVNTSIVELGFWTSRPNQNKGYATLATKILVASAFEAFGYQRVEVTCNITNDASRRVIEKCGFLYEGTKRNHLTAPTTQMIMDGYIAGRDTLCFALVKEDIPQLPWYDDILTRLTFTTYFGETINYKQ